MPFPTSAASSTSTSTSTSATDEHFSFEATLNRISSLQSTLTMHQRSSHLLRRQIKREQRALKHDKAELARLEDALRSSYSLRQKQERGLHRLARAVDETEAWEEEDDDDQGDGDEGGGKQTTKRETIDKVNSIAGISTHPAHGDATEGPVFLDSPDLEPLLNQLRNHLHSMEGNTASMQPVLAAMSDAQFALDLFAAARFDEQTRRRLHGLDP